MSGDAREASARRRRGRTRADVARGGRRARARDGAKRALESRREGGGEEGENEPDEEDGAAARGDGSTLDASLEHASDVGWRIADGDVNRAFDEARRGQRGCGRARLGVDGGLEEALGVGGEVFAG